MNYCMIRRWGPVVAGAMLANAYVMPLDPRYIPPGDGFCETGALPRATVDQIHYEGNTGLADHYGCNLKLIEERMLEHFDYTVSFLNVAEADQTCACWLKIGPDGGVNGFWKGNEVLDFPLRIGQTRVLAIDTDTQGGCACGIDEEVPVTADGQFAATWLEFDMANESNGGWSGADASCLVSAAYGLDIPSLQ
ncbi:hypothetical protein S40288_10420, partial [Stachybotrys chartarum IBT 40288]